MHRAIASLTRIVDESDAPSQSLAVVNRTEPDAITRLLREAVAGHVDVADVDVPDGEDDVVVLLRDGDVVATSPLQAVMDTSLLVNADLYQTGLSGIDKHEAPDVVTELDDTVFDLRGFPASNKEKLLLIVVSRFIEGLALHHGDGRLRSTFQRLSRLWQEPGTHEVYRRLADSDVETHVYGLFGGTVDVPDDLADLTVHTGDHAGYRESWCVVYVPEDPADRHAALVAIETDDNEWRGMWTYDAERVRAVDRILAEEF